MSCKSTMYVVEGETEERFLKEMIYLNYIRPGRIKIYNIMQNEICESDSIMLKKNDVIFCFIDTDCIERKNLNKFCNNIKFLKKIGRVIVFVQNKNFEDELRKIFGVTDLKATFGCRGHIKEYLAQEIVYERRLSKDDLKKYCKFPEQFIECYKSCGYVIKGYEINTGCGKCCL